MDTHVVESVWPHARSDAVVQLHPTERAVLIDRFAGLVLRWRLCGAEADALLDAGPGDAACLLRGRADAHHLGRARLAVEVDALALAMLGEPDDVRSWLRMPNAALLHATPLGRACDRAGGLDLVAIALRADVRNPGRTAW